MTREACEQEVFQMDSPLKVVQRFVEAFNARDEVALTPCFHSEAVIIGPDGNVMTRGSEALNGLYAQSCAQSPDLHADIVTRVSVRNLVVDEEQVSGVLFE